MSHKHPEHPVKVSDTTQVIASALSEDEIKELEKTPTPKNIPNAPASVMWFEPAMPVIPSAPVDYLQHEKLRLSIVVMVYKMPEQAKKTLYSLSTAYQHGVSADEYEIIVVENPSSKMLGKEDAEKWGPNFRYFAYPETGTSPVPAMNFGATHARGRMVGVMIDGARMVSPGVVNYIIAAERLHPNAIVAVPGYHLGDKVQQEAMLEGYDESYEQAMLDRIKWPQDGYRLFEVACLSGTSQSGYFKPLGESNVLAMPRPIWDKLGGFDPGFTETGGGQCNLDLHKRAVELPETVLVTLIGEGSFHQFHGGITTGTKGKERLDIMQSHFNQYAALRGGAYRPPLKRAIFLGAMPDCAMKFARHSSSVIMKNRKEIPKDWK
ncbi:MAG TPA: glycosyltransferase family A protein [Pseudomonadales bacterium]|nr:glycosyltransferase family A protein [Pseudomonadales bacterium]